MRILVVTQYFWPENFRINDLVSELIDLGHEITVLTGYPNYPSGAIFSDFKSSPGAFSKFEGANVIRVPLIPRGKGGIKLILNYISFAFTATIFGACRLRGCKFDLIFVFEPSPITVGLPAIFLRWIKGIPVAFWVLDLWPETLSAIGVVQSKFLLKHLGYLVSFIYNRCDLILAQSKSFIPSIRQYLTRDVRVEYFPSWSDASFDYSRVELAPEVPAAKDTFTIMFAGNVGEAQDFPAILKAAEILKDCSQIRWLILGDGRLSDWVHKEILMRGLEERVFLLGRHPVDRVPSFFMHADVLLVALKNTPIFSYTIPGKLQSYLAAGIPIVAMLNGEGAKIINDSGAGIACPAGDSAALVNAIHQIINLSSEDRLKMRVAGLKVAKNEFDRNGLINKLVSWFMELKLCNDERRKFCK